MPVSVVEIELKKDRYVFVVRPHKRVEAEDIGQYFKEIALALACPVEQLGLKVPLSDGRHFGVTIMRVNFFGEGFNENLVKPILPGKGLFGKNKSKKLLDTSWNYFIQFYKQFHLVKRYGFGNKYLAMYKKLSIGKLVEAFNDHVGKPETAREKASRLFVLQDLFDSMHLDYSEILSPAGGISDRSKIRFERKKLLPV